LFILSDKKRERGNFLYRRKEYSFALQCYQNALKFLDINENPLLKEEDNQSSILIDRYIQVENNLAQVYLLNNKYEECLNAVNNVLKYDSNNIKALFRQGKALIELGNYDHAIQPLKFLLQNQNQNIEREKVKEMLNFCETKLAKYQKTEKEIYKRMFQSKPTINDKPQINNNQKV
jgi:tetratricopeptide (TPR) repeat protein